MGSNLLWCCLRFFAFFVLACLVLRELTGDRFLPVRLFTYLTPWFLIPLMAALVIALLGQRWTTAALAAVPLAAILHAYLPQLIPRPAPPPTPGGFTVMSFNIWSKNDRVDEIASLLRKERPDILLLQEVDPQRHAQILRALEGLSPGEALNSAFAPELMQAVVSRFPLDGCETYRGKGQAQKVRVTTPAGEITVFNVHPLRRGGWRHRHGRLLHLLSQEVLPVREGVIVAGDFNTTEGSEIYRLLSSHLRNAHREGGYGFGFTYPAAGVQGMGPIFLPALVRIDHIFVNGRLKVRRAGTLPMAAGSDHRPVFAELYPTTPWPGGGAPVAPVGQKSMCVERD